MNKKYQNPALQEEPIGEPASIIAPRENESLFRWIKPLGDCETVTFVETRSFF